MYLEPRAFLRFYSGMNCASLRERPGVSLFSLAQLEIVHKNMAATPSKGIMFGFSQRHLSWGGGRGVLEQWKTLNSC